MKKKDIQIAELRLALTRASAALHAIAAHIRAADIEVGIELAGVHSLAFCAERAARQAAEIGNKR